MSHFILSAQNMAALENAAFAEGITVSELMQRAIKACSDFFLIRFPVRDFKHVALLAGPGHNGGDAFGTGCELLRHGHSVVALLVSAHNELKPLTQKMRLEFEKLGGVVFLCQSEENLKSCSDASEFAMASVWIDGLFGFGLNRATVGLESHAIAFVNRLCKPVVAIDIPSGLSCDYGNIGGAHICASHTLALGALKPAHVDDDVLSSLGEVHYLDLQLSQYRGKISAPLWNAIGTSDFKELLAESRRSQASHKYTNGRLLVIAGSERYPGAGVLACLGAGVSGAGMIHALVPMQARMALLTRAPEIIFENHIPALNLFSAIVIGPGWVPGNEQIFAQVLKHALANKETQLIIDAGAFSFLSKLLHDGIPLAENIVLTPHLGEFSRLFPEAADRIHNALTEKRINRIEAVAWAAKMSSAVVLLKGARTHVASPDGVVASIMHSSPLLAHAGQGDVLAGLLGGLAARGLQSKKAAQLAALHQAETALWFSSQYPNALTLPPSELVRQMQLLQLP